MKNFLKLVLMACVFLLIQQASNICPECFLAISWKIIMVAEGLIVVALGILGFIWFCGNTKIRILLTVLVPVVANVTQEIIIGSDRAYPLFFIALLGPYVILSLLGAFIGAIIERKVQEKRGRRE